MAHTSIPIPNHNAWNDTGLTGPVSFWVPGGSFLLSTGATPPTDDDNARLVNADSAGGETVSYGGTDRVWIKPISGANRIVQES